MIKSRLRILRDYLLKIAPEKVQAKRKRKFNLRRWRCNTSACAIGSACFHPVFRKLGLKWNRWYPQFKTAEGWDAVENFFGLTSLQAVSLFFYQYYPSQGATTATEVAERIEKFLSTGRI